MATSLHARANDERGVVLVLVAILMVVIMGAAALAIDLGSFYKAQRQAQSAADAGALAAAQDLPNAVAATTDGQNYATANYPGATPTVNATSSQVTVSVTATTPSFFGQFLGLTHANVSARAVAAQTALPCSTPGNTCYAIFASDPNCPTGTSATYGVKFNGAGDTVLGGVHSNGSIYLDGGSQSLGPTTIGNGTNCTVLQGGSGDQFAGGNYTRQTPFVQGYWPDNYYSTTFPACTPGSTCTGACAVSTTPCPAADQTPSYCTVASTSSITISSGNGVYCAVGSGTASDPSKYSGYIDLIDQSTSPIVSATMLAGAVECGVRTCAAQPYQSTYPLICAADTDAQASSGPGTPSYAFTGTGKDENFTGAIFAPNGTIEFNGKGGTDNFLEAKDVVLTGQDFTGDGPSDGSGSSATVSESLLQ